LPPAGSAGEGQRGEIDGRGLPPAGSAGEGQRGEIDGRGLPPAGSAGEGQRGHVDERSAALRAGEPAGGAGRRGLDADVIHIEVRDRGIGLHASETERIFGKFERAVSTAHYGGLGLGLYISRQIVEAHRGWIEVESTPGRGSTFRVVLPLREPQ
jgi:signal transduction histidine kinase